MIQQTFGRLIMIRSILLLAISLFASSAHAGLILNNDFENDWPTYNPASRYAYNPTGEDIHWDFVKGSGLTDSSTAWGGVALDGGRFAFLQGTGSFSQNFYLEQDSFLFLDFLWASRKSTPQEQWIKVTIDNIEIEHFKADSFDWNQSLTDAGIFLKGEHTITFSGVPQLNIDISAFIDNVSLTASDVDSPSPLGLILIPLMCWVSFRRLKNT